MNPRAGRSHRDAPRRVAHLGAALALSAAAALAALSAAPALAAVPELDPIVGAWDATLDANGDAVPAGVVFTSDGVVLVTTAQSPGGTAVGSWARVGDVYHVRVVAHLEGTDGVVIMEQSGRIGPDGTLSAEGTATLTPESGEPQAMPFSATATRITVELPEGAALPEPTVTRAAGDGPDAIKAAVEAFTVPFGKDNGGVPGPFSDGYRRVVWDKVPTEQSAPKTYSPSFFNGTADPRARGIVFSGTEGDLMVSAGKDAGKGGMRFGNINHSYPGTFQAFSPEKLFSPLGGNEVVVTFFQPGTSTPATTAGFSAVFADVDLAGATTLEPLREDGSSLGVFAADPADGGLSFLGVSYAEPLIAGVRITLGTVPLGPTDSAEADVVVLDDLHYAEPQPKP